MENFYERHQNDTNLVDMDLWDADMIKHVKIELFLFSKYKEHFFNVSCESDKTNACVATGKDWEHSSYLKFSTPNTRNNTSIRKLTNHNTANPHQVLRPAIPGMKKNISSSVGFMKTNNNSTPITSYLVYAINRTSELITGNIVLSQTNERFSPLNNVGISSHCYCHVK